MSQHQHQVVALDWFRPILIKGVEDTIEDSIQLAVRTSKRLAEEDHEERTAGGDVPVKRQRNASQSEELFASMDFNLVVTETGYWEKCCKLAGSQLRANLDSKSKLPPRLRSKEINTMRPKTEDEEDGNAVPQVGSPQAPVNSSSENAAPSEPNQGAGVVVRGGIQRENLNTLFTVTLYRAEKGSRSQEFEILGSQTLLDLRNSFYCLSDHNHIHEPFESTSYFFIDNCFYERQLNGVSYVRPILNFIAQQRQAGGTFPHRISFSPDVCPEGMNVQLRDLSFRLGQPYLYCHQGTCEHVVIFKEIRFLDKDTVVDALQADERLFPRRTFQFKIRQRKCSICDVHVARNISYGDLLVDISPCFFCEDCFSKLHYGADGTLLQDEKGKFEYYKYHHE